MSVARPDVGEPGWAPRTLADLLARATPSLASAPLAERRAVAGREVDEANVAHEALARERRRGGAFLALLSAGSEVALADAAWRHEQQQAAAAQALVDVSVLRAISETSPPFGLWVALRALRRALASPVVLLGRVVARAHQPWPVPGLGRGLVVWALFAVVAAARDGGGPHAASGTGAGAGPYRARPTFERSRPKRREVEWLAHLRAHRGREYLDACLLALRHLAVLDAMGPDPTLEDGDREHAGAIDHHHAALTSRCHELQALVIRCEIPGALLHEAYSQSEGATRGVEHGNWARVHHLAIAAAERLVMVVCLAAGVPCSMDALEAELLAFARDGTLPHARSRQLFTQLAGELHARGWFRFQAESDALRHRERQLDHASARARAAITTADWLDVLEDSPAEQALDQAARARVDVVVALDQLAPRRRMILAEVVARHPVVPLALGAGAIWQQVSAIRIVSSGKSSYLSGKEDALHLHRAWRQRATSFVHLVSPTEIAGALASYDFDVYLRR